MMNPSTVMDATTKMTAETTIMVVVAAIIVIFVVVVVVVVVVVDVDVDFVVEVPSELPDGTSFHFVAVVWGRLLAFLVYRFRRRPTNQPTNHVPHRLSDHPSSRQPVRLPAPRRAVCV